MKKLLLLLVPMILFSSIYAKDIEKPSQEKIDKKLNSLKKPLFTPFVENYILNDLKQLRDDNKKLKVELYKRLAEKEVEISTNAINYATSTINNIFYIIAAASSLLVIIGLNSIRDVNQKIRTIVDEKVSKVIDDYEKRMSLIEKDLDKRSKQVLQNQKEIEKTNTIHSLWIRAAQETTPSGKIEIYDDILKIKPYDAEALTYKAEAALELEEANWALHLANQALNIDDDYPNAFYQKAKANAVLGYSDFAINDLEKALMLNEQYIEEIENEEEFDSLNENKKFITLIKKYKQDSETN
ncbi:hypothetical protein CPU12_01845 [Malaciobacter molluscorum LMG 25693]|uniref:Membrane protein n=1 Tax=Malaciobacter molluscorum LMG 25693 TaxID=870501 RepID=A0A2G1DKG4_9BACT|nr:hypothetical protein [Malaciobacter molluscorum]AXX92589.1 putative membrane protein [Malaciobacter molluscorum LMG 25693]PHO19013.1 hypothetical protein CPU12_01845 [Malaciobacter molluscorum LMG 25693]RXJ97320.1 hypothetical protein CRV00_00335 [Malaciobacter molluscorum]